MARRVVIATGVAHAASDFLPRSLTRDDVPDFVRAAGDCACTWCGKPYWKHPGDPYEVTREGVRWLTVLCDGRRVKL